MIVGWCLPSIDGEVFVFITVPVSIQLLQTGFLAFLQYLFLLTTSGSGLLYLQRCCESLPWGGMF